MTSQVERPRPVVDRDPRRQVLDDAATILIMHAVADNGDCAGCFRERRRQVPHRACPQVAWALRSIETGVTDESAWDASA